jgi:hypothetical protein
LTPPIKEAALRRPWRTPAFAATREAALSIVRVKPGDEFGGDPDPAGDTRASIAPIRLQKIH